MIERIAFGTTGQHSSRTLFGAAGLGSMSQAQADRVLAQLLAHGVNHIDTAAAYGDSELRIAPWLRAHPGHFFVATKTAERGRAGAAASIRRSLQRLGVERLDLIQLHNLVETADREQALGPDGALQACIEAREAGLVRFIGVTGHGTHAAAAHARSLEVFAFDSVLLPYSFTMLAQPEYAADVEALLALCEQRGVAVQTIKCAARRRWPQPPARRFSWYEPLRDVGALRRAVHFVLARPGLFLNTSSDTTLLPAILRAACEPPHAPREEELRGDTQRLEMAPLFVRGVSDQI